MLAELDGLLVLSELSAWLRLVKVHSHAGCDRLPSQSCCNDVLWYPGLGVLTECQKIVVQVPTVEGLCVRVINNVRKKTDVRPKFAEAFQHENHPSTFPYTQKVRAATVD